MPVVPTPIRRYRSSLVAILLFIAYAVVLFVHNLNVQQRLEQSLLDAASLELAKRAEASTAYFSERHNTLANLATSNAIANYFAGLDLGMSQEYGLGVHSQAIEDRLEHLIAQERLGTTRIYEKIALLDSEGKLVVEAGALPSVPPENYAALVAQLGETRSVTLLDSHELMRFSQPIKLRGRLRGHVIAYTPISVIASQAGTAKTLRPEALVIASSGHAVSPAAGEIFSDPAITQLLAGLAPGETRRTADFPAFGDDQPIAAIKQGIEGSPLALAAVITERELSAHAPLSLFLAAAGAVPFIVLYIVLLELRERRQVERALAIAKAEAHSEAEKLARTRSEFIANMSHEIRTPLNAVLGLAQVGQRDLTGRQAKQQFTRIIESGEHLLGIINDILDCAKIEAGKLSLEKITFEPGQVIDKAITLTAERAFARGLTFEVREHALPTHCQGDPLRLSQVLVNLLGNAIKFTEHGSVILELAIEGDWLHFQIKDTGVGMNQAQIARIFLPFEQADSSTTRRFGGSGLGLSITAHLIKAMGGTIEVSSSPDAGSCFSVKIPLIKPIFASPPATRSHLVLAGFPQDDAAPLIADLQARGLDAIAIDTPAALPDATKLVVVDARLNNAPQQWRDWMLSLHATAVPLALAGRLNEINRAELPEQLSTQLPLIERPLRSRHIIACMNNQPMEQAVQPTASPQASLRLAGLSVLAVDDNEVNRMVLAEMLRHEGARVECMASGTAALARLAERGAQSFDIILTDIQMPGMDGYELARQLRATYPDIPVLGLTAHAGDDTRAQCLAAGMLAHITKPIRLDILVNETLRHCTPPTVVTALEPAPEAPVLEAPRSARPPTTAVVSSQDLIDWPALEAQFKGRSSFITRITAKAALTYRDDVARLRELALGNGSFADISFLAHNIKGSAGVLKANAIHELAAATNLAARAEQADSHTLAASLADQLDQLILELDAHLGEEGPA